MTLYAPPTAFYHAKPFRKLWDLPDLKIRLNLGCGNDIKKGWVNIDRDHPKADLKFDLCDHWPLENASACLIWANQIVEHLPPMKHGKDCFQHFLEEAARTLRPGGRIMLSVPYPGSAVDLCNHTHYRRFHPESLHFLANKDSTLHTGLPLKLISTHIIRVPPFAESAKRLPNGPPKAPSFYPNVGKKVGIAWVLERVL